MSSYEPDKLATPACLIVAGSAQAGKTTFIKQLIIERDELFTKKFKQIYYFYMEWQPVFEELEKQHGVIFEQGVPSSERLNEIENSSMAIFDDMMTSLCSSNDLVDLVTVKSHHRSIFVVIITQQFYWDSKQMRCVSRNSHYVALFKQVASSGNY